jgi:hypothetical protein
MNEAEEILRRNCTVFAKGKLRDLLNTGIPLHEDTEVIFAILEVPIKGKTFVEAGHE